MKFKDIFESVLDMKNARSEKKARRILTILVNLIRKNGGRIKVEKNGEDVREILIRKKFFNNNIKTEEEMAMFNEISDYIFEIIGEYKISQEKENGVWYYKLYGEGNEF